MTGYEPPAVEELGDVDRLTECFAVSPGCDHQHGPGQSGMGHPGQPGNPGRGP